jgi:hypothetical protein
MNVRRLLTASSLLMPVLFGCASDPENSATQGSGGGSTSSGSGTAGSGGGPGGGQVFVGGECPSDVGFPQAQTLPNLTGNVVGQTVRIQFDPRAGARDYRVYALPAKGDVSGDTNRNAVYRCGGNYQVVEAINEDAPLPQSYGVRTMIESQILGYERSAVDATLGYVFTTPGKNRIPVYALGDSAEDADNGCYFQRWPESRVKKYTTSRSERDELLAKHWRDDGIPFYVPADGAANARKVFTGVATGDTIGNWSESTIYVAEGDELEFRKENGSRMTPAFSVYATPEPGSEPLKRVYYGNGCGSSHDELAVTEARFQKTYKQGTQPVAELHWSGLTEDTTLVVEAVDALCPFRGVLSPMSRPPGTDTGVDYPAFLSLDQMREASPTGEVYVGGMGDANAQPRAIARACLHLEPSEPAPADWRYDGKAETYSEPQNVALAMYHLESPTFQIEFYGQPANEWAIGSMFGELWTIHADVGANVSGLLRMMPKEKATMAADAFVHVSMQVDTLSTGRRYPQILISDQSWPITQNLKEGSTIIVQPFGDGPTEAQIEFCDHRDWAVNAQCPRWDLQLLESGGEPFLSPRVEMNGLQGLDRTVRFDAYASTRRVYLFTNGVPYGCVELPEGRMPEGPTTITFGDALYHSGADLNSGLGPWYPFHDVHMKEFMPRHFSNLAFSSGLQQPGWDHARIPCVPASGLKLQ